MELLKKQLRIGVIGGRATNKENYKIAKEVGKQIALENAILICGGYGGIMEAACKGAKSVGGFTVGILPDDTDKYVNSYVDLPIITGIGLARNTIIVRTSQVIIAINGKYGTLSEIAYALQWNVPVIGISTWKISEKIIKAKNAKEAVKIAIEKAKIL